MTAGIGFAVKERFQGICDFGRVIERSKCEPGWRRAEAFEMAPILCWGAPCVSGLVLSPEKFKFKWLALYSDLNIRFATKATHGPQVNKSEH